MGRARIAAATAILLLLVACGAAPHRAGLSAERASALVSASPPVPLPSPMPSPTPTRPVASPTPTHPPASPSAAPPPNPTPKPAPTGGPPAPPVPVPAGPGFGVFIAPSPPFTGSRSPWTISLVDASGNTVASTPANQPGLITCAGQTLSSDQTAAPVVSTSSDLVYFRDGDTALKSLAKDGSVHSVRTLPGGAQTRSTFAVSADDTRIAIAVWDYSKSCSPSVSAYVENLAGGGHVSLSLPSGDYWPVGWSGSRLVLAAVDTGHQPLEYFYAPLNSITYYLVQNASGSFGQVGPCAISGSLPTPNGFGCGGPPARSDWNGFVTTVDPSSFSTGGTSLSTDGATLAVCCYNGPYIELFSTAGGSPVPTNASGYPNDGGWLDTYHVVYRVAGTSNDAILDTHSLAVTSVPPATGILIARLPGGL